MSFVVAFNLCGKDIQFKSNDKYFSIKSVYMIISY